MSEQHQDITVPASVTSAKRAYLDQARLEDAQQEARKKSVVERFTRLAEAMQSQPAGDARPRRPEIEQASAEIDRRRLWAAAMIPAGFRDADLAKLPPGLPDGYVAAAASLMTLLDEPGPRLIVGDRETGKTWLACGLCRIFCRALRRTLYLQLREAFDRMAFAPFDQKEAAREALIRPALLVMDNAHMRIAGREDDQLQVLIDRRSAERRCTVLILPMTISEALRNVGPLVATRVQRSGPVVETSWPRIPAIFRAREPQARTLCPLAGGAG
jgi:DNA replication protein DnaC